MAYMSLERIIDIDGEIDSERLEKIDQIIRALLITRKGTIPGSRSFGLPGQFVDAPEPEAANMVAVGLAEALTEYAPEVSVDRVEINGQVDGSLGLKVYVGGRQ